MGRDVESLEAVLPRPVAAPPASLWRLAQILIWISTTAFGGASIIMLRRQVCTRYGWMTEREFLELYAMAQVSPGSIPVSLNCLIGRKLCGTPGFFVSLFAGTVPGFVVLMTLALLSMSPHMDVLRHALKGAAAVAVGMVLANAMELTHPHRRKPADMLIICLAALAVVVFHLGLAATLLVFLPLSIVVLRIAGEL